MPAVLVIGPTVTQNFGNSILVIDTTTAVLTAPTHRRMAGYQLV